MIGGVSRFLAGKLRLALVVLAVVGQLLIGAAVPAAASVPDASTLFGLAGAICHAPAESGVPGNPPGHHHDDCALCPLCCTLAPAAVLSAPPPLPKPVIILVVRPAQLPPATGPPAFSRATPPPRGPPAQA